MKWTRDVDNAMKNRLRFNMVLGLFSALCVVGASVRALRSWARNFDVDLEDRPRA